MLPKDILEKKAELINYGKIHIPKGFALPYYPSRSTAGPGAGRPALVFGFAGTRVKLGIDREGTAKFSLARKPNKIDQDNSASQRRCVQGKPYMILKDDEIFINDVVLEPTLMHAPCQAFINITNDCIYNCSFCVSPDLNKRSKTCSVSRWIELILAHAENPSLKSVAITSGVAESPHNTVLEMVTIIKAVREKLPEIPIGVEPYVTANEDIDLLYNAGATELKLNIETSNREIFDKICPDLDYDGILKSLKYAVSVFGKNRVCSNLIVGLGESDSHILTVVDLMAADGIVATLRAIRINDINGPKLNATLGFTPEPVAPKRLLKLAGKQKEILNKYQLSTVEFQTMCHQCKSCDIVPQQDV